MHELCMFMSANMIFNPLFFRAPRDYSHQDLVFQSWMYDIALFSIFVDSQIKEPHMPLLLPMAFLFLIVVMIIYSQPYILIFCICIYKGILKT